MYLYYYYYNFISLRDTNLPQEAAVGQKSLFSPKVEAMMFSLSFCVENSERFNVMLLFKISL